MATTKTPKLVTVVERNWKDMTPSGQPITWTRHLSRCGLTLCGLSTLTNHNMLPASAVRGIIHNCKHCYVGVK